jgi:hypothetical protein
MFRRRRRRSSFARRAPPQVKYVAYGVAAVVFVGLFVFFIRQSDTLAPEPQEISVALPDAFKE